MERPRPHSLTDALIRDGDLKLWSVVVTILGDLAPDKGASLPGPALSALIAAVGLSPDALRVALHRLRKDGWLESTRCGRISRYSLTPMGRSETAQVRDRVYRRDLPAGPGWTIAILPPGGAAPAQGLPLGDRCALIPAGLAAPGAITAPLGTGALPPWIEAELIPVDARAGYAALAQTLERAPGDTPDTPLARLALRVVLLHRWRRLTLRHSDLADQLLGPDWQGARLRRQVMDWLDRLPRSDLAQILEAG